MPYTGISEKQFMQQVLDLARLQGWMCYHTFTSVRSCAGFPDLIMVKREVMLAVEVKLDNTHETLYQRHWLERLGAVEGVFAMTWRPRDWPMVEAVLTAKDKTAVRAALKEHDAQVLSATA